jgi:molecular chaperone GrpE
MNDKRSRDKDNIMNEPAATEGEFNVTGQSAQDSDTTVEEIVSETDKLKSELQETKEKYIRLVAEFDNFRKRNAKEKLEIIQTASKDVLVSMLEVLDDADRAQQQMEASSDPDEIKKGVLLVFNKLRNILKSKGIKKMEAKGEKFNPDLHEAIAEIPGEEKMRGKVVEVVQNGYYLNDKIIRFAKVVVGK